MTNMKWIAAAAVTVIALAPLSAQARGGDAVAGAEKAKACAACHGEGGAKPIQADYPILAGQHEDYLIAVLKQYKSGKRKNEVMKGFAAALTDKDMRDLAAYFAKQPGPLRMKY